MFFHRYFLITRSPDVEWADRLPFDALGYSHLVQVIFKFFSATKTDDVWTTAHSISKAVTVDRSEYA
jgi:hypothetical protein